MTEDDLNQGCILPPLKKIRSLSLAIATAVAEAAYRDGLATVPKPKDLRALIQSNMYIPNYRDYQ